MKKTIPITIAGTLFYIEEDAYNKLKEYLDSVKSHFASYEDSGEIIADIESRMAEQFLENAKGTKEKIVTLTEVDKFISVMGNPADFGDNNEPHNNSKEQSTAQAKSRRLYRNPDDAIIAGVASGIAAYFGIDPIIVRLIFVLVVFAGGSGILIYIILWIAIPQAKTATEKLQMRGEPINLESVNQMVKEKVEEVKKNKSSISKGLGVIFRFFGIIVRGFFKILAKIIGLAIVIASVFAIFWIIFAFTVSLFNINSPYVDFPLAEIVKGPVFYVGLIALFFAAFVPLIFLSLVGTSLVQKKSSFRIAPSVTLVVLWFAALTTLGVVASKVVPEYQNYIHTNPEYQQVNKSYDLKDFTAIEIRNGNSVSLTQGDSFLVTGSGSAKELENLDIYTEKGTLYIKTADKFKICIFCGGGDVHFTVQLPNQIVAANGSSITASKFIINDLDISLTNASRLKMEGSFINLTVVEENASRAELSGSVQNATYEAYNASRLIAKDLVAQNVVIKLRNRSSAEINAVVKLEAYALNASHIYYHGNPTLTELESNGSRIEKSPVSPAQPPTPEFPIE
jgi:phage shock protein PspC (stress-responsive transcriptional regulator)